MKGKIALAVGFGVGYVFGARAGRARYNQIKKAAERIWETDVVQDSAAKVQDFAADRGEEIRAVVGRTVGAAIAKPKKRAQNSSSTAKNTKTSSTKKSTAKNSK